MIHDPLAQRRRALAAGAGMSVLIAAGAGILAWLQPNPDPGAAPIVRTAQGQILAQADGVYHPVPNLVSAQLIVGAPEQAAAIGDEQLRRAQLGAPAGLADAPGFLNPAPSSSPWALCQTAPRDEAQFVTQLDADVVSGATVVHAGLDVEALRDGEAALVRAEGNTWVLTREGRRGVPEGQLGVAVRRALGVSADAPTWEAPVEFLNAIPELPAYSVPEDLPAIWDTGHGLWARTGAGVAPLTEAQAQALTLLGARTDGVDAEAVAQVNQADPSFVLPAAAVGLVEPGPRWLCVSEERVGTAAAEEGLIPLPGDSVATHVGGLDGGVAVDTGHGSLVVSATGTRHAVKGHESWAALGLSTPAAVPWEIVRLLPEGSELSREAALRLEP